MPKRKPTTAASYFVLDHQDELLQTGTADVATADTTSSLGSWMEIDAAGQAEEAAETSAKRARTPPPPTPTPPAASTSARTPKEVRSSLGSVAVGSAAKWVPPPPGLGAPRPIGKSKFGGWKVDELRGHLRELGLQTSGPKQLLIDRLDGHYSGAPQLQAGCSTARVAPDFSISAAYAGMPAGTRSKCGVCGKYGHTGGDASCPFRAETLAFQAARRGHREQREQALAAVGPAPRAPAPKPAKGGYGAKGKDKEGPRCPRCKASMFRRGDAFICSNETSMLRCPGTIAASSVQ